MEDRRTEVSAETRRAEHDEAVAPHVADRPPTDEERADTAGDAPDEEVAEHYRDMAGRGARQEGEGRIP